jgi:hypothetical protein
MLAVLELEQLDVFSLLQVKPKLDFANVIVPKFHHVHLSALAVLVQYPYASIRVHPRLSH